jgi:CRP-like cAMP-binding protein
MKTIQVKKGEILQRAGEKCKHAYFVKKGLLRSYKIDSKGKEHVYMFASEGWYISDIDAQVFNIESELYIDTIEDCVLEQTPTAEFDLSNMTLNSDEALRIFKRTSILQRRVLMLLSATARERYEHFIETYNDIVDRAPQKMIATYLGITPEALSKIRGEIARGN